MDDDLATRAATFDEVLSDDFELGCAAVRAADRADNALGAWCDSASAGDWELFYRRLGRDGLTRSDVRARFAAGRRRESAPRPQWALDAEWIRDALQSSAAVPPAEAGGPFEHVWAPLLTEAQARLWSSLSPPEADRFSDEARADLRRLLADRLCGLSAPALYERFVQSDLGYTGFVAELNTGGLHRLFADKPVLLRLVAVLTRQWLTTTAEFAARLHDDLDRIGRVIVRRPLRGPVRHVAGGYSDTHRGGHSVLRVDVDGAHVMYKPKDLKLDVAWHTLVTRLNGAAPMELRAPLAIAGDGYGWTEYIEHTACNDGDGAARYFRRAGAWLALLHCLVAADMHHENIIAAGDHPVPVDVETLLQPSAVHADDGRPEAPSRAAARARIADSVAAVGLLPAYGKSAVGVRVAGGVAAQWPTGHRLVWSDVNTDAMRASKVAEPPRVPSNLPLVGDRHVGLKDHVEDFISGFRDYAGFLHEADDLFGGFIGLDVRTVHRPTQFYSMLLHRLRDDRTMDDGVAWSMQADFVARLADWDSSDDPRWDLRRAERAALLELDVPFFTAPADVGIHRGRDRVGGLDPDQIAWQVEVIRQTSPDLDPCSVDTATGEAEDAVALPHSAVLAEADAIAARIGDCAVRDGPGAAWIGLGWFPDSDVSQLAVLGDDFYNGACGIATFLAAHAHASGNAESADLAVAALTGLRADLGGTRSARIARILGIGGATGIGSIVYGLTCVSRLLRDDGLLTDALRAARLITDDLIESDTQLDVIGGSAGAILSLLRLYRDTGDDEVLDRALTCGRHLLAHERSGDVGRRSWACRVAGNQTLNGMSHGAAGFAYALAALSAATGCDEFADAAVECLAFEHANFDERQDDWRDMRMAQPHRRSQWCHGAVGIGLARLGISALGGQWADTVRPDIDRAITSTAHCWPAHADTLCCGGLGSVELARQADLGEVSSRRLSAIVTAKAATGDYRWSAPVSTRFNVGLFRGLAGVGYTCLREVDDSLPNVLIWQ